MTTTATGTCLETVEAVHALRDRLEGMGVRHLALPGSSLRRDAQPDGDLDVLVELDGAVQVVSCRGEVTRRARLELAISGALSDICGLDVSVATRERHPPRYFGRMADGLDEVF